MRQAPCQLPSIPLVSTNTLQLAQFWQWPHDLVDEPYDTAMATAVCFREGRFWIQVLYKGQDFRLHKAFVFSVDPITFAKEIIELPLIEEKVATSATNTWLAVNTGESFEVLGDSLFFTMRDKIKRYSLARRVWDELPMPAAGRLIVLDGRLFVTTDDSIAELSKDGMSQTILASTRRRPATTILDTLEHYEKPSLFHGPDSSLATWIQKRFYVLDDASKRWSEASSLPNRPAVAANVRPGCAWALGYTRATWGTNQLFLPFNADGVAFSRPPPPSATRTNWSIRQCRSEDPLWVLMDEVSTPPACVYLPEAEAWISFRELAMATNAARQLVLKGWIGRRGYGGPPVVQAIWNDAVIQLPLQLGLSKAVFNPVFVRELLTGAGGRQLAVSATPMPAGIALISPRIGLWLLRSDELATHLNYARKYMLAQSQAQRAARDALWTTLLQKYQLSQKENFTPEQKEAMIDDPAFLELSLETIDGNRNGRLDPAELAFFDSNQNGTLEPREHEAIEIVLTLATQRLRHDYDRAEDARLDVTEFSALLEDTTIWRLRRPGPQPANLIGLDQDNDGALDTAELYTFLRRDLLRSLNPSLGPPNESADVFRGRIEGYWYEQATGGARRPLGLRGPTQGAAQSR